MGNVLDICSNTDYTAYRIVYSILRNQENQKTATDNQENQKTGQKADQNEGGNERAC
jgi:hypothetical protein